MFVHTVIMVIEPHMKQGRQHKLISTIFLATSVTKKLDHNKALSPQEELVQDIVSILQVFSCRLYGLRKYKNQIEKDEDIAKELQDGNKSDRGTES